MCKSYLYYKYKSTRFSKYKLYFGCVRETDATCMSDVLSFSSSLMYRHRPPTIFIYDLLVINITASTGGNNAYLVGPSDRGYYR